MAGSASEQSEANPVLWLVTQQASWTLDFSLFWSSTVKMSVIEWQRSAEDSQTWEFIFNFLINNAYLQRSEAQNWGHDQTELWQTFLPFKCHCLRTQHIVLIRAWLKPYVSICMLLTRLFCCIVHTHVMKSTHSKEPQGCTFRVQIWLIRCNLWN